MKTISSNTKIALALTACALALTACTPAAKTSIPMSTLTPPVSQAPPPSANPGSLYSLGDSSFLFEDNRARRVGDIVMVNIIENSTGQNTAKTKSNRTSSTNMGVSAFFNNTSMDASPIDLLTGADINNLGMKSPVGAHPQIATTSTNNLTTDGSTQRSSQVTATVGCRIINVLPGPVFQIEGARQTRVNDENQILVVRGLIRPTDIAQDNTIPSSALADAQVEYYGEGSLGDRQKPGWLTRVMDNIYPF
ncbi:MAG: flagellar basal body L-ring protein FlgH [Desulfovibrionaceae bacterium]|nr:flagellar basal body L-ring protein FlgH [Desulfovibrionaceae bacterium]MBF0512955.1 flagellar basal body L-ring protein FlgH [Desulfovibrionaceae bacterium]